MNTPRDMTPPRPFEAFLVLASRFRNIEVAERAIVDLGAAAGLTSDDEYWLVTALREAVANAMRHGNHEDPTLKVTIDCSISPQRVAIAVADEGDGFNPESIPDPTDAANLLRPCGRGIFYMRKFMTRVEFDRTATGGTLVLMERDLQPPGRRPTDEI